MLKMVFAFIKRISLALLVTGFFIPADTQASIIAHKIKPGSVVFTLDKGLMQVTVCKADIIEVKYTIFNSFSDKPSLVVNNKWQYPAFKLTENKDEYISPRQG